MECALPECGLRVEPKGRGRSPKYCPPHQAGRHGARTVARATGGTRFVGVDGEGWTDELGEHRYAQLSIGSSTLFGAEHLDCMEVFTFLWAGFEEDPRASYVGFYLGYDFAQWFRTLPEHVAHSLLASDGIAKRRRKTSGGNTVPFPVRYRGWEFDILGNKRFKLRRHGSEAWMYICDTGPFFQSSFMTVLDPKKWPNGSPVSEEEYRVIAEGKLKRADYSTREQWLAAEDELTRYNVYENAALSKVMGEYEKGLTAVGVHLERDQWYGPGQAAQAWMDNIALTKREDLETVIPPEVFEFARESYYGGRFEVFAHGHIPGESWEADITSAYPFAMSMLPRWEECEFQWRSESSSRARGETIWTSGGGLALLDCTSVAPTAVATGLPHREKNGRILYPRKTRGVRWSFEVDASIAAGLTATVQVHRALVIVPKGSGHTTWLPLMGEDDAATSWVGAPWSAGLPLPPTPENTVSGTRSDAPSWDGSWGNPMSASTADLSKDPGRLITSFLSDWADSTNETTWSGPVENATDRSPGANRSSFSVLAQEVPGMFQQRIDVGKESSQGKAIKLVLNSLYGKQAQSVGSPKFSNPLSASFITAHCRSMILLALAAQPEKDRDLLMIATDAIYYRTRPVGLDEGNNLGQWELKKLSNLTLVMPGVHYSDEARAALSAGSVKVKSRGIPAAAFAASIGRLDVAFSTLANDPTVSESWPVLDVPIKFKVKTPKAALNEGKWGRAGTVERDVDRKLSTDPSLKRQGPASAQLLLFGDTSGLPYLDRGIVRTVPHDEGAAVESTPYSKDFGIMMDGEGWGVGPDQDMQGNLMDLLRGD